jgi:hypothetical protein
LFVNFSRQDKLSLTLGNPMYFYFLSRFIKRDWSYMFTVNYSLILIYFKKEKNYLLISLLSVRTSSPLYHDVISTYFSIFFGTVHLRKATLLRNTSYPFTLTSYGWWRTAWIWIFLLIIDPALFDAWHRYTWSCMSER